MLDVKEAKLALRDTDPEIFALIGEEERYQQDSIRLIPSENYVSQAVLEASGSVLTNKYSEGYPGKRYYEGQLYIDQLETLVQDRAKALFGVEHANVQPYSGSPANLATYYALLEPGDKIMGMSLPHGGHLTHGWSVNFSARFYTAVQYVVDETTHLIDYDKVRELAKKERPRIIVAGATAYPRQFDFATLGEIAREVDAYFLADIAHIAGLIVAGVHPDPAPHADVITTTTHKTLRGPRGGMVLCDQRFARRIDRGVFPGSQGGPMMHVIAGKAVMAKEAATPEFSQHAHQIVDNARALAEALSGSGLRLVSGGTDTHLVLVDVTSLDTNGQEAADSLERAGIVVNKNAIPFDELPPTLGSGVRLGTPALTSRGMGVEQLTRVGELIGEVLASKADAAVEQRTRAEVLELCEAFPAPGIG